jgi:hypothetical protein
MRGCPASTTAGAQHYLVYGAGHRVPVHGELLSNSFRNRRFDWKQAVHSRFKTKKRHEQLNRARSVETFMPP